MVEDGPSTQSNQAFYEKQKAFWENQPATIDGDFGGGGGYGKLHEIDTLYSKKVLSEYLDLLPGKNRAFDLGCGVGRNTKYILSDIFDKIDLADISSSQLA